MWDAIQSVLSTENGLLAAALATMWQWFAGNKRAAIEARVKEAAQAAWRSVVAIGGTLGLTPEQLAGTARDRAFVLLARLGIKRTSDIAKLVEHELEMLAIDHAFANLPDLGDPATLFDAAEARGKAAGKARSEYFETVTEAKP